MCIVLGERVVKTLMARIEKGQKQGVHFFILLSVPSKFKHKRVKHILNYQMFETLTMIGNDECRFSSCLVSGIIFC